MTFTLEQLEPMLLDNGGYCISCGAEHYGIEPDANNYTCDECGEKKVFAAEEILILGLCV